MGPSKVTGKASGLPKHPFFFIIILFFFFQSSLICLVTLQHVLHARVLALKCLGFSFAFAVGAVFVFSSRKADNYSFVHTSYNAFFCCVLISWKMSQLGSAKQAILFPAVGTSLLSFLETLWTYVTKWSGKSLLQRA